MTFGFDGFHSFKNPRCVTDQLSGDKFYAPPLLLISEHVFTTVELLLIILSTLYCWKKSTTRRQFEEIEWKKNLNKKTS